MGRGRPSIAVSEARGVRTLHVGGEAIQSSMRLEDPFALALDYTRCMMAFLLFHPEPRQALMIGIRCERGSHRFFKRYGERFEDSEGKQIFLEFATEERAHLELLINEYRALVHRQRRRRVRVRRKPRQAATA